MTTIPINDLQRTYAATSDELDRAAREVMRSGWWLNGPRNKLFCDAFSEYLGIAYCVGVANGTDALEIVLRVLLQRSAGSGTGWISQDSTAGVPEIVTVANAGGYTVTACHISGCVPVFADIERDSQLISIPSAVAAITDSTIAVVTTHLYGGLVDVPALRQAMDAAGYERIPIIEDCAQAHGLSGCGGKAGAFGLMATFSFYPTKNLGTLGDAGAIVTDDRECFEHVHRLQQYGWSEKYKVVSSGGRNSRLDELQAAFLTELLPKLDAANARRKAILDAYQTAAPPGVEIVRSASGTVAHLAVVMTNDRDKLRAYLHARGIATDIHYPILDCEQEGWQDMPQRIGPSGLEVSRECVGKILTVPCFPTMTEGEVAAVCDALRSYIPE